MLRCYASALCTGAADRAWVGTEAPWSVIRLGCRRTVDPVDNFCGAGPYIFRSILLFCLTIIALFKFSLAVAADPPSTQERMFEWTVESQKAYRDPFNDVDVDVVFDRAGESWRVPAFWRGGQRWSVRFTPPIDGEYAYHLECTDRSNPDLNGHAGRVTMLPYRGPNDLLRHGLLRVSITGRYFEHLDGVPFYWLGDTWWTELSDRISWEDFQRLTRDRKTKGFTVVQIVAGLVPSEEQAPEDPGFHNEGGDVWDSGFQRINPQYFDYADRRILHLLDAGIVPAIVGGWNPVLGQMGVSKMKQHWRYIVARYGAYPAFWIVGGEVMDPPPSVADRYPKAIRAFVTPGWTEIARYVRSIDPYHHPLTVHEPSPPYDTALQDETLTDFDLVQSGHYGWASIGVEVSQLNQHYSRTLVTKPVVEGEIGYEKLGETHFEDFQRAAFWLSMLNGAAGHTYGANGTWEAYSGDKPLHRYRDSFVSWEEGMNLPGSYQIGLNSKLLRQYPWWRFTPHPEWVNPRGTTLLEPHDQLNGFAYGTYEPCGDCDPGDRVKRLESTYVAQEWKERDGTFRLPYAAGIPGEVRFIYIPAIGLFPPDAPTIEGLESEVRYHAFWWEVSTGTRIDLGAIEHPKPGLLLFDSGDAVKRTHAWNLYSVDTLADNKDGQTNALGPFTVVAALKSVKETNMVATVQVKNNLSAGLVLRFRDRNNYVAAFYSAEQRKLFIVERIKGVDSRRLGATATDGMGAPFRLSAEVRDGRAAASIQDGHHAYPTPIINLTEDPAAGGVGVFDEERTVKDRYGHFQARRSPSLVRDEGLDRSLDDASGVHRGDLRGRGMDVDGYRVPGWDSFGLSKSLLLDAYRPDRLPTAGDWVLVLERQR